MTKRSWAVKSTRLACLTLGLTFWLCQYGNVIAAPLQADCEATTVDKSEKIVCQIRAKSGRSLTDVEVAQGDGSPLAATLRPFNWVTDPVAYYFLVQTSGVSRGQMRRMGQFLQRTASPVGERIVGIGTADGALVEKAPLGTYRHTLDRIARSLTRSMPGEDDSVLMSSIDEAIEKVSKKSADRKAVIVLSDAAPPDRGVNEGEIVRQARNNNVSLYFISFGEDEKVPSGTLKRIGNQTSGGTFDVSNLTDSELLEFASSLLSMHESGFVAKIDASGLPQTYQLVATGELEGHGNVESDSVELERLTEDGWMIKTQQFFADHYLTILAALGLGAGALLILASLPSLGGVFAKVPALPLPGQSGAGAVPSPEVDRPAETQILFRPEVDGSNSAALAWLELLGSDAPRVPLHSGSLKLGRSKENDIRLSDQSVHRRHAILQLSSEGTYSIHDLGTRNGVIVNGARCSQQELSDGDIIELGETKLRFVKR